MISNTHKRILYSLLVFTVFVFGVALQIKADIGQAVNTALALTLSQVTPIKIGTWVNILNLAVFIVYAFIRKFKFTFDDFVIVVITLLNGIFINFFVDVVLKDLTLSTYATRFIVFIIGLVIANIALGLLLALGIFGFPMEKLSIELANRTKYSLKTIRYTFDVVFIVVTVGLTLLFKTPWSIREGTLIMFVSLSFMIGFFYDFFSKKLAYLYDTKSSK